MLRGYGSVAAPLLAGFDLAAVITLSTAEREPPWVDPALACLTLATAIALLSVVLSFFASGYWWPPAEMAAWRPEITVDGGELARARIQQRVYLRIFTSLWRRSVVAYQVALLATLLGLAAALVPAELAEGRFGQAPVWRTLAVGIAVGAVLVTALTALALPSARLTRLLLVTGKPRRWMPDPVAGPAPSVLAALAPTEAAATALAARSARAELHAVWAPESAESGAAAVVARTRSGAWRLAGTAEHPVVLSPDSAFCGDPAAVAVTLERLAHAFGRGRRGRARRPGPAVDSR